MPSIRNALVIILAASLISACVSPRRGGRMQGGMDPTGAQILLPGALLFASFDVDGDYRINSAEMEAGLHHSFGRADVDGSGALSLFEYENWAAEGLGAKDALPGWIGIDANGDHSITEKEFRDGFLRIAARYGLGDADGIQFSKLTRSVGPMMGAGEPRERRTRVEQERRREPDEEGN